MKVMMLFLFFGILNPITVKAENMAELLGKAQELSSQISSLSDLGDKKIQSPKVQDYNNEMEQTNSLTQQALSQVARKLNVNLPASSSDNLVTKGLEGLKGAAFEQSFLNKSAGLQTKLLELVKSKIIPNLNSPMVSGLLQSFTLGLGKLVEKAKLLQGAIGKK